MADSLTYQYQQASLLQKDQLLLSHYSEIQKKEASCFFWGKLTQPFLTARCLIALSQIVKSSFNLSPFQLALLKDPIVTAGNGKIRFEGFSHCAGVYARLDIMPDGHDGEFPENGTTNVDFNAPMLSALNRVQKQSKVVLSVGPKEVSLSQGGNKVVERKVPLPTKWIKGLSAVQLYLADTSPRFSLNRMQAVQLFRALPRGNPKTDYYLIMRGGRPGFSPVNHKEGMCVGGIHRLRLLTPLLPLADRLEVFGHPQDQISCWQLHLGKLRFTFAISRDTWRGFSGEGAGLEALIEDVPEAWISRLDNYSYVNQSFNPTLLAIEENLQAEQVSHISAQLSAMGLLGFDLTENGYFYRRLPFKLSRVLSLNPRLKGVEKLLEAGKVHIQVREAERVEALVEGSGVVHTVILEANKARCTCTWYNRHQGERGACKHILAVKKKIQ